MKKSSKNNNQVTTEANTSMLSQERKNGTNARRETSFYSTQPTNDNTSSTNKSDTRAYMMALGTKLQNLYVKMLRMRKIMLILLVALGASVVYVILVTLSYRYQF